MTRHLIISIVVFLFFSFDYVSAQSVGIGTSKPNTSAQLDVSSTTKGFLPPRMTVAERNSIKSPAAGLIIFCTDCENGEMQFYNGSNWMQMKRSLYQPTIVTESVSNITNTSATITSNVISDGGLPVTERGVCWSMYPNPTIAVEKTSDGAGKGVFTSELTDLTPLTTYYVRAYAINSLGTVYGEEKNFFAESRNKYDGIYEVTGTFKDVSTAGATFTARYPLIYFLVTTGPGSADVCMIINGEVVPGYLFNAGASASFYGRWGLQIFFDPTTDAITELRNYYGDPANPSNGVGDPSGGSGAPDYIASNTRQATLDPTGINAYDAVSKTIRIKYFMLQPSVVPTGPRCFFEETWKYVEPRP